VASVGLSSVDESIFPEPETFVLGTERLVLSDPEKFELPETEKLELPEKFESTEKFELTDLFELSKIFELVLEAPARIESLEPDDDEVAFIIIVEFKLLEPDDDDSFFIITEFSLSFVSS